MTKEILKEHALSFAQTFLASFLLTILTTLQGDVTWTGAFWGSVALAAARSAIKEGFARFAPISLGGRK